jgi:hypothetical protein
MLVKFLKFYFYCILICIYGLDLFIIKINLMRPNCSDSGSVSVNI